ncbi:MAG: ECF transporter S component [Clostridia bacterium]|nr:ECF transporter S component [Clostridia bacterium]
MKKSSKKNIIRLVLTAMMAALSVVFMFVVRFSLLPGAKFLEYDMGDIPVILSTLFLGTPAGAFVLVFVSLIQSLTVSAASSWQGFVMHVLSTGAYVITLKLITRKNDDRKHLVAGAVISTLVLTAIMIPLNLIFTPLYLNTTVDAVLQLMLPAIVPFNFLKGVINSLIIVLLYGPLKEILKKSNMLNKK